MARVRRAEIAGEWPNMNTLAVDDADGRQLRIQLVNVNNLLTRPYDRAEAAVRIAQAVRDFYPGQPIEVTVRIVTLSPYFLGSLEIIG